MMTKKSKDVPEHFDLSVEVKLADGDAPTGTFDGHASVFDLLDRGGDIVKRGAFKASLAAWRKKDQLPPMLWSHDMSKPIGVWTEIAEDEKGLHVVGELNLETQGGREAHALLKQGAISGLSIGYSTEDFDIDRNTGARHLKKVALWEISLVSIPMLEEAQISNVKTIREFKSRDMEIALRDAGLSKSAAVTATAIFKNWLQSDSGGSEAPLRDEARACLMTFRKAAERLRT